MKIYYLSKTGNVKRLANKLANIGFEIVKVTDDLVAIEDGILLTYTAPKGQIPDTIYNFLKQNHSSIKAVVCSGNMNWGRLYCKCADLIFEEFNIPTLLKLELSGTENDVQIIANYIRNNDT